MGKKQAVFIYKRANLNVMSSRTEILNFTYAVVDEFRLQRWVRPQMFSMLIYVENEHAWWVHNWLLVLFKVVT